jgi:hypothetical protein
MNNLSTIITNIKERISIISLNEPIFIYIGVGTYAGLKNNNGILEPQNYHQYPPFLQDLKNKIVNLNLFIILIDPLQEQPPYMVGALPPDPRQQILMLDTHNPENRPQWQANQSELLPLVYTSNDRKLVLFSLLQSVYTDPYECHENYVNITTDLRELNKYAMEENITLLYHDFTGRRNSLLAEYFDPEIKIHLNHIIYGMSARQDHGCYFDLTLPSSYFPWVKHNGQRPCIKLFNIFHYIVNDSLNSIGQDAQYYTSPVSVDVNTMINTQIEQVLSTIKSDLINHMLSLLRIIFRLIVGDEQQAEINMEHSFNFISKPNREVCIKLYNDNKYIELYDKLIDYFSRDIGIAGKLKNHDLSGKEILQFIVYGDKPYEWYSNVKHFF